MIQKTLKNENVLKKKSELPKMFQAHTQHSYSKHQWNETEDLIIDL